MTVKVGVLALWWSVATGDVAAPVSSSSWDGFWLDQMRHRADSFRQCVSLMAEREPALESYPVFVDKAGNTGFACREPELSAIHVWKTGGTTIDVVMKGLCDETYHPLTKLPVGNETVFTFARNPADRFQSALFELGHRRERFVVDLVNKSWEVNRTVVSLAIDALLERPWWNTDLHHALPDPHLGPQFRFLVDRGEPLDIHYIGVTSRFMPEQLRAIAAGFLGWTPDSDIPESVFAQHSRDSTNPKYVNRLPGVTDGPFGPIHDEPIDAETLAKIHEYFRVDYTCLGFWM